jgi:hypothetical protein
MRLSSPFLSNLKQQQCPNPRIRGVIFPSVESSRAVALLSSFLLPNFLQHRYHFPNVGKKVRT